jgi:hypothetical protein
MKLDSKNRASAMAETHDHLIIRAPGGHDQAIRQIVIGNDQGMVPPDMHRAGTVAEDTFFVV